jgi:hypothetical protein
METALGREVTSAEMEALKLAKARLVTRSKLESGEIHPDTMERMPIDVGAMKRRKAIRERNLKLMKEFAPGGKHAGRKLDLAALFAGHEMSQEAHRPGGVDAALAVELSLPKALAYLRFLQGEGRTAATRLDYEHVTY